MTADVELLPLPSVLLNWPHPTNHVAIRDYALANVEANTEALRAEVAKLQALRKHHRARHKSYKRRHADAIARAELLEEALRDVADRMKGQAKWEPCDCGCPNKRAPLDAASVAWVRAADMLNRALLRDQEEGK